MKEEFQTLKSLSLVCMLSLETLSNNLSNLEITFSIGHIMIPKLQWRDYLLLMVQSGKVATSDH